MFTPDAPCVFDDPTAFHAAHHVLNPYADAGKPPVLGLLLRRERTTTGLFRRLRDRTSRDAKPLKAQILIQHAARWEHIVLLVGHRCSVPGAFRSAASRILFCESQA